MAINFNIEKVIDENNLKAYEELALVRKEIVGDLEIIKSYNDSIMQNNHSLKLELVKQEQIENKIEFMKVLDENNQKIQAINTLIISLLK